MKLFDKDTKEEVKGKDALFAAKPLSPMAAEKLDHYRKHGLGSGKILNLSACNLTDAMVPALVEWLAEYKDDIASLGLYCNKLTSVGAEMLFDSLLHIDGTKKLLLMQNEINDSCMESLGNYLRFSDTIEYVDIGQNLISDHGISQLETTLCGNVSIKTLGLSSNKGITEKSIDAFQSIAKRTSIEEVYLFGTKLHPSHIEMIQSAFSLPIESREIPVASTSKSAAKR